MYDPIIFDLDGTLLNTLGDLAAAGNFALSEMGLPRHTEEEFRLFVGNGISKLVERMLPNNSSDEEKKTARALFGEYYELHKSDRTKPYDGISELLTELKHKGITALCVTNKDHAFSEALLRSFFGENITEVVGAGLGFPIKPDPGAVLYLAEKYRRDGKTPLYIGDSGVDMETAKNAGITACGVLWGFRDREELTRYDPEYLAKNAQELREIILSNGK